jgi:hypothetical protein
MAAVWTIEINGVAQKYKTLELHRKLILNTPTNFSATIEYDPDIHFMDVVEIKRNGTVEWKGYIEKLNPYWDSEGQFFDISGRDITMILWKKYNDDFTNFAQKTAGMFGTVNPMQLLHFILHTPKTEIGIDYPYNKEGWGLDFSRTIDTERVVSTYTDINDANLAIGNPSWVFSRERGYGWSGTGRETYFAEDKTLDNVTGVGGSWYAVGPAPSPYIDANTLNPLACPTDIRFIKTTAVGIPIVGATFTCEIPPFDLTNKTVKGVIVTIIYSAFITGHFQEKKDGFKVEMYSASQGTTKPILVSNVYPNLNGGIIYGLKYWYVASWDITKYITDKTDLESPNLAFMISTLGDWIWAGNLSGIMIGYIHLTVTTATPNDAHQTSGDTFEIAFRPELLIPSGSNTSAIDTPLSIDRDGIVGEYLLNEGAGTSGAIIHDSTGLNPMGVAYDVSWYVQAPPSTQTPVIYFNGTLSYIDCGHNFTWLNGHNHMSIDVWVSVTDLSTLGVGWNNFIVYRENQFRLMFNDTGALRLGLMIGGAYSWVTSDDGVIVQNGRTHIQALYDGYSMNLYVNNELVASQAENGYIETPVGTSHLYIGQMYGYMSDLLIYNRATYPHITALYVECRGNPNYYPRAYTVEYLDGSVTPWVVIPNTSPTMPQVYNVTTNPYPPDIIISFPSISTQKVRIRLTGSYASPWGISQIYIYKPETIKYRPYLDSTETDPSTPPATDPYVYTGGPYIHAFNNQLSTIANPIGPLNMSRQRMLDVVNYLIGLSSDTSIGENEVVGFLPFEWWLSYDANNTFNIKNQKGSDKTGTIIFQDGVNLGSCNYNQFIDDTVQNVYVVGQGEQKKLQDTSLWVKSEKATGNATNGQPLANAEKTVRTFFEDAIQDKTIVIDDYKYPAIGNMVGSSNLTINAMPRVQLNITLSKDTYTSMDYDVGDVVTVIDSLNGINGTYRIQNIDKTIQADIGEDITITLGYPNYKFEDELQHMYRNMKSFGIVGTFNDDWSAEGTDKKLLDARLISQQSQFSQNAENDKMSQNIAYNSTLWNTYTVQYSSPSVPSYASDNHFFWGSGWFGMSAHTQAGAWDGTNLNSWFMQTVLKGNVVDYYNPNQEPVAPHLVHGCDAANISMTWNPHLTMEIKLLDGLYSDIAGASWNYGHWNRGDNPATVNGDYCRIGMSDEGGVTGFWFMFVKISSDVIGDPDFASPALFDVFVQWTLADGTTNFDRDAFNWENKSLYGSMNSPNGTYIKTILGNTRYKIEMVTQSDPDFIATQTPNVKFNLYEYKTTLSTTNEGLTLNYVQLSYPTLGIVVNSSIALMTVKPLECEMFNLAQQTSANDGPSAVNFYNWNTEWTVKRVSTEG